MKLTLRIFLAAFASLAAATLHAQQPAKPLAMPVAVTRAEKTYAEEVATLQRLRDQAKAALDRNCAEAVAKERAKLVEALEAAKADAAKAVNLPLANAIQKRIEAVKGEGEETVAVAPPSGKVVVYYGPGKARTYMFANRQMVYVEPQMRFTFRLDEIGGIEATRSDGEVDRWIPCGPQKWIVKHFKAGAAEPFAIGFAAL